MSSPTISRTAQRPSSSLWAEVAASDIHSLPEHTPEWIEALEATKKFSDASRYYEFSDGTRFILPLMKRTGIAGAGGQLQSYPRGWGMGGLVGAPLDSGHVHAVLKDLRGLKMQRVSIHPDPLRDEPWREGAEMAGAHLVSRLAHVVDLEGGEEAVWARLTKSARRGTRLAERAGVRIKTGNSLDLLRDYHRLFQLSVDRWAVERNQPKAIARLLARRRFPIEDLLLLRKSLGERFVVVGAYLGGDPVLSTIVLLGHNGHEIHSAMDREKIGRSRAGDAAQWESLRMACEIGCRFHHLGESGENKNLALTKEKYSAKPYQYAEVVLEPFPWTKLDASLRRAVKGIFGTSQAQ